MGHRPTRRWERSPATAAGEGSSGIAAASASTRTMSRAGEDSLPATAEATETATLLTEWPTASSLTKRRRARDRAWSTLGTTYRTVVLVSAPVAPPSVSFCLPLRLFPLTLGLPSRTLQVPLDLSSLSLLRPSMGPLLALDLTPPVSLIALQILPLLHHVPDLLAHNGLRLPVHLAIVSGGISIGLLRSPDLLPCLLDCFFRDNIVRAREPLIKV